MIILGKEASEEERNLVLLDRTAVATIHAVTQRKHIDHRRREMLLHKSYVRTTQLHSFGP